MRTTLASVKSLVARRARIVIICFAALAAGAFAAVLTAPPVYEGQMKILVKRDRSDSVVSGTAGSAPDGTNLSETELLSQVELIRAKDVLQKVADQAGLVKRLLDEDPDRNPAEALAVATADLSKELEVAPIKRTWLIDVVYKSGDRRLAREVLDKLSTLYLEKHLALHRPTGSYQFFATQAEQARQELETAKQRLAEFSRQYHVAAAGTQKDGTLQKLIEFDGLREQAAANLAETMQRERAIKDEMSRVPAQHTSEVRTTDNAGVVQEVQSRILTLEMKRTELLQKFTPTYRGVVEIDEQLKSAKAALAETLSTPVRQETIADNPTHQWLDGELARARTEGAAVRARMTALSSAVNGYRSQAQTLEERELEHDDLLRALKTAESKYLVYTQKKEEARISDELDKTRIANVTIAQAPAVSLIPKRTPSMAALPFLLGASFLISLAIAFAFDASPWAAGENARRVSRAIDELRRRNDLLDARLRGRAYPATSSQAPIPVEADGLT